MKKEKPSLLAKCGRSLVIKRKRQPSASRERKTVSKAVNSPGPGLCPSCNLPFDRSRKRRLIDSCGHERCYSCIFRTDACPLCLQTGSSPPKLSRVGATSKTAAVDEDEEEKENATQCKPGMEGDLTHDSGFFSSGSLSVHQEQLHTSMELDNTLPRRRKEAGGGGKRLSLASPSCTTNTINLGAPTAISNAIMTSSASSNNNYSSTPPPSLSPIPHRNGAPSLFSRQVPELSPSHIYCQITQPAFLKPLYFEVPRSSPSPLVGRAWLFREVLDHLTAHLPVTPGAVVLGGPGAGKTAVILSLVEASCFGQGGRVVHKGENQGGSHLSRLASHLVAYHFCQADNATTCLVPEFVHSIAAQMSQAPQLSAYFQLIQGEPEVQALLSLPSCHADPTTSLVKGILQPLAHLARQGKINTSEICMIVIDGLCEADQLRPDYGDTLAGFLAKNLNHFPAWLKLFCTVRSNQQELTRELPFYRVSLDNTDSDERLAKDLTDYVAVRVAASSRIVANIRHSKTVTDGELVARLTAHLVSKARGCFLYIKLILDLLERGNIVVKSATFKVLPQTLSEIYQLAFNQRFSSVQAYEQVTDMLSISLASLQAVNLPELFNILSALSVSAELSWKEFRDRYSSISDYLVMRTDGSVMFSHPTLRDWLLRRRHGEPTRFLCDVRTGHAAIAFAIARQTKPIKPERVLDLVHHTLKANLLKNVDQSNMSYRDVQAAFISLATEDISAALGCPRNIFTPLLKVSRVLLLAGANPNYVTTSLDSSPILGVYAHLGNREMVLLLLDYCADVNGANKQGRTALAMAAMAGHEDIVQVLAQAGAQINRVDQEAECALVLAARGGHTLVVELLVSQEWQNDPVHSLTLEEAVQQALSTALANGHHQVADILLDIPSTDINMTDTLTGLTPLCAAAKAGDTSGGEILLKRQARVDRWDLNEQGPVHIAAREGHWAMLDLLLQAGARVEDKDGQGRTPLSMAAASGHHGIAELLITRGAVVEAKDKEGITPLSHAIISGQLDTVRSLLDHNADVNCLDNSGRSPLDVAVYQGREELVELLLERGANMEKKDLRGIRVLDRVIAYGSASVVTAFLRKGAKLGPATWMMAEGKPEILLILLNKLLDDGNTLYRQGRLPDAAHRYRYALRRLPRTGLDSWAQTFQTLQTHLLLNLSRCERRMDRHAEAVALASQVLATSPHSVEALVARAKAHRAAGRLQEALHDLALAHDLMPANREVQKALQRAREDLSSNRGQLLKLTAATFPSTESIAYIDNASSV